MTAIMAKSDEASTAISRQRYEEVRSGPGALPAPSQLTRRGCEKGLPGRVPGGGP